MKESFQNEYLNQKLEPENTDQLIPEDFKLADYEEFGEHSYSAEKGRWEFKIGDTKILLEFSKPLIEDFFDGKYVVSELLFLSILDRKTFETSEGAKSLREKIDQIRLIDKISIENDNSKFDSEDIFRNGKILFNFPESFKVASQINLDSNEISLGADPLTPKGLITLLHEIGHYQDLNTGDEEARQIIAKQYEQKWRFMDASDALLSDPNSKQEITTEDATAVLMRERSAWALALKAFRQFNKDLKFKINGLDSLVHGRCLESYSENIRMMIEYNDLIQKNASLNAILEERKELLREVIKKSQEPEENKQ